jgi:hypothetical protein
VIENNIGRVAVSLSVIIHSKDLQPSIEQELLLLSGESVAIQDHPGCWMFTGGI